MTGISEEIIHENIDWYIDMLECENGLKDRCIRDGSKLLNKNNSLSLIGMVSYAENIGANGEEFDNWLTEYAAKNNMYFPDQKRNFLHMKQDFDQYLKKCA